MLKISVLSIYSLLILVHTIAKKATVRETALDLLVAMTNQTLVTPES